MKYIVNKYNDISLYTAQDLVFYKFYEYCVRLSLPVSPHTLGAYTKFQLPTDINKLKISTPDIAEALKSKSAEGYKEAAEILSVLLTTAYESNSNQDKPFNLVFSEWINKMLTENIVQLTQDMYNSIGVEKVTDPQDDLQIMISRLAHYKELFNKEAVKDLDSAITGLAFHDYEQDDKAFRVAFKLDDKFGEFSDKVGMFYANTINFLAGLPGSGKTRFSIGEITAKALEEGKSVRFENLEQGESHIRNMLVSNYIARHYAMQLDDVKVGLGKLSDTEKNMVNTAREKLFSGQDKTRGSLYFPTTPLTVEGMSDVMIDYFKLHPDVKIWVIDYLALFQTAEKRREVNTAEIILKALKELQIIKKSVEGLTIIALTQYTREGTQRARNDMPFSEEDLQGGQATVQYADKIICLTQNEAQRANGMFLGMKVVKERYGNLSNCILRANKAVCKFDLHEMRQ